VAFGSFTYDAFATLAGWQLCRRSWRANARRSADERMAWQLARLQRLLIDAGAHVPYYRRLFEEMGFNPAADFRHLDDLAGLPTLSKDQVREHADDLKRRPLPARAICERTSGSTGEPLAVWIAPAQIAVEKATVWRHWHWLGYRFRDPVAIVRTYVPRDGEPLWRYDRARNFLYFSAYHLDECNATDFLRRVQRFRPRFLRGYPSSLAILADVAAARGVPVDGLKAVLTASETLTDQVRAKLHTTFAAPVCDWYGLAEQVVTAAQCGHGDGLHCHDDYGIWELRPLDDGTGRCRIIGTNLHNTAMPLIRYETGDLAVPGHANRCPCGRTFPRIARVTGREDDELIDPSGRRIPAVNFYSVFREFPAIRRFQMIQHRADLLEVRLDTGAWNADDERELRHVLQDRIGRGMALRLVRDREFEKNPQGKRRAVISHVRRTKARHEVTA